MFFACSSSPSPASLQSLFLLLCEPGRARAAYREKRRVGTKRKENKKEKKVILKYDPPSKRRNTHVLRFSTRFWLGTDGRDPPEGASVLRFLAGARGKAQTSSCTLQTSGPSLLHSLSQTTALPSALPGDRPCFLSHPTARVVHLAVIASNDTQFSDRPTDRAQQSIFYWLLFACFWHRCLDNSRYTPLLCVFLPRPTRRHNGHLGREAEDVLVSWFCLVILGFCVCILFCAVLRGSPPACWLAAILRAYVFSWPTPCHRADMPLTGAASQPGRTKRRLLDLSRFRSTMGSPRAPPPAPSTTYLLLPLIAC